MRRLLSARKKKHFVKPKCKFKCRFIQISDELWLCPHAAFGAVSDLKGGVEEGRRLLAKAGGYDFVLGRIEADEAEKKRDRVEERERLREIAQDALKYR